VTTKFLATGGKVPKFELIPKFFGAKGGSGVRVVGYTPRRTITQENVESKTQQYSKVFKTVLEFVSAVALARKSATHQKTVESLSRNVQTHNIAVSQLLFHGRHLLL